MGTPTLIGETLKEFFGGEIPTPEIVSKVISTRQSVLPINGLCNKKGSMDVEVYKVISRSLRVERLPTQKEVCAVCRRQRCPVKKA